MMKALTFHTQVIKMGKFEIDKDKIGEWRFRLKANNGKIIAHGEGYKTKQGMLNGIESVKANSDSPIVYT